MEFEWLITYSNGVELSQYSSKGKKMSQADIDRQLVVEIAYVKKGTKEKYLVLPVRNGDTFILRKRIEKEIGAEKPKRVLAIAGVQNMSTKNQCISVLFDNGKVITTHSWAEEGTELYGILAPPVIVPNEGEQWVL